MAGVYNCNAFRFFVGSVARYMGPAVAEYGGAGIAAAEQKFINELKSINGARDTPLEPCGTVRQRHRKIASKRQATPAGGGIARRPADGAVRAQA